MSKLLFDFRDPRAVLNWRAIDDRVMGGLSQSRLRHDEAGHAVFEGEVSLERNGGFASVRCAPGDHGLAGAQQCLIEISGPAPAFKLNLFSSDGFDGLSYQHDFTPAGPGWQTLALALADFVPRFRGRDVPGAPPLQPQRIRQVGLMIANRRAGRFFLALRRIELV